jgi:hypothetical protein
VFRNQHRVLGIIHPRTGIVHRDLIVMPIAHVQSDDFVPGFEQKPRSYAGIHSSRKSDHDAHAAKVAQCVLCASVGQPNGVGLTFRLEMKELGWPFKKVRIFFEGGPPAQATPFMNLRHRKKQ